MTIDQCLRGRPLNEQNNLDMRCKSSISRNLELYNRTVQTRHKSKISVKNIEILLAEHNKPKYIKKRTFVEFLGVSIRDSELTMRVLVSVTEQQK
jgi:hypothetical protein